MKIAMYPGTFDPITNGHFDIILRASTLFDKVHVVVSDNPSKKTLFSVEERVHLIKELTKDIKNIEVSSSGGLSVHYARKLGAKFIVRGLRATLDFEYELNIFASNNHLDKDIDTVFLMTKLENSFISSSGIKEMVYYNADAKGLVDPIVEKAIKEKYENLKGDEHCI
ncbi:pantetheine-phosphate adenylyltransferase [Bacilli bacterium PM5-3]|nr:pantetheine-phosphate adenylyltransferase [Bacilli bacterium PM5-3]MDH6602926.1 pantetheine-phosphate adenylyltransferase [Bacilli bacterium PM5-9]